MALPVKKGNRWIKASGMLLLLISAMTATANAREPDTLAAPENSLKVGMQPLYYDFFDIREQFRIGLEYERTITASSFAACYIDMGLYDNYTFIKYYDFFSAGKGMYFLENDVSVRGFHVLPSYHYYFWKHKKKHHTGACGGVLADFHFYNKKIAHLNSQTFERTRGRYYQTGLGMGISLAGKYLIWRNFFAEIRTALIFKIYIQPTREDVPPTKPSHAQWTGKQNKYWWLSDFMIGYAF